MGTALRLTVNGVSEDYGAATVEALLSDLGLDRRKVAVERNLVIVPRSLYGSTPLSEQDRIEIVHFIGGG